MNMKLISSKYVDEQRYGLFVTAAKEAKTKELKVSLILEEKGGVHERVILGVYLIRNLVKKEYMKDLGDRIPMLLLWEETEEVKKEWEEIHSQICEYCLSCEAETDADNCDIVEAKERVVEYVRMHEAEKLWWITEKECIVLYEAVEELLGLVDCGWRNRQEFAQALVANEFVKRSKDGHIARKIAGDRWALKINLTEE